MITLPGLGAIKHLARRSRVGSCRGRSPGVIMHVVPRHLGVIMHVVPRHLGVIMHVVPRHVSVIMHVVAGAGGASRVLLRRETEDDLLALDVG